MAYSEDNPPRLIAQATGVLGGGLWHYSGVDALAIVNNANFFSNGYELGMRPGDMVMVANSTDYTAFMSVVRSVDPVGGGVDLGNGIDVSTGDSD